MFSQEQTFYGASRATSASQSIIHVLIFIGFSYLKRAVINIPPKCAVNFKEAAKAALALAPTARLPHCVS